MDKINKKIDADNHRNCALDGDRDEYDCNKYDMEKLDKTSQLSKGDRDLDWVGNNLNSSYNNKVKKRKRRYLECENQVQCDDRDDKNDKEEKSQKKRSTAKCSSCDSESNFQNLEKRKRHKQKKMKSRILSSASVLQMGYEETEVGDHHSEKKRLRPDKTDTPSCSEIEICYTDICCNGKKKKIPNHQLHGIDDNEICISKKIGKELKQIAQSSVPSKILSDFTEASDVHVNKKKSNNSPSLEELKLDSEELGNGSITRKTKVNVTVCPTTKRKGGGESHHSSSCKVNASTRDACKNHLSRCDKESLFNPDITTVINVDCDTETSAVPFTVNPHESKQYENDSKSVLEGNHHQLSESESIISSNDFDYDDDHYNVPYKVKRRCRRLKSSNNVPSNNDLLTTDDEKFRLKRKDVGMGSVAMYNIPKYKMNIETDPHSFSNEECSKNSRSKHGRLKVKSFDEMLYRFPPGEGTPPEEIEKIPDKYKHWERFYRRLYDNNYTVEEIKEEIESKINHVFGYFTRLEKESLTEKELEEFLENLDIKITWTLSPLHEAYLQRNMGKRKGNCENRGIRKKASGFQIVRGLFTHNEKMIMLRNWIRFQEEYEFYDLRPLVGLRTARIHKEGGCIVFRSFRYISQQCESKFALYIAQGLPQRKPQVAFTRFKKLSTYLKNNELLRTHRQVSGRILGKMLYMLKMYGFCFIGPELIVGHYTFEQFVDAYYTHVWMQNIELRKGPWTEEESLRLRRGIYEIHKVKSLREAFENKIDWIKILPYVRTRNYRNMRQYVQREIARSDHNSVIYNRISLKKIIDLVYSSGVESIHAIDWHAISLHFPQQNPYLLSRLFRKKYYATPYENRVTVEDGIKYLYEKVCPRLSHLKVIIPSTATLSEFKKFYGESSESGERHIDDCSISKETVNNSVMCKTDAAPKKNTDSAGESQELVNTEARSLASSSHTYHSKAHYMSASDSE
ncbi:uncharacterized protein [Panulirus ornatus]|uniref:uncharacterized protein isoform X2 n=1 Tax=Panulirus ornatus TaxID=150431 RepID=UPI003A896F8D